VPLQDSAGAVLDTSWPLTPSEPPPPPPSRRVRPPVEVDPELSSAISEAVAEAIAPPTEIEVEVVKAPTKRKSAAAKKDAASKKGTVSKKVAAKKALPEKAVTEKAATKKAAAKKAAPKKAAEKKVAAEMKPAAAKKSTLKKAAARTDGDQLQSVQSADGSLPKRRSATPPPAVNAPLSFINFVATYPVGTTVEGEVVSFTSHGAMVDVTLPDGGRLHCYIPLSAMGDPPPTKARQVLTKGSVRPFVLSSLDPPRRVAELSLPEPPAKKRRSPAKKAAKATS
jgi:hypothetical protein